MNDGKLIIHIGTHKTGSTAIQAYLQSAQKSLVKQSVGILCDQGEISKAWYAALSGDITSLADLFNASMKGKRALIVSFEGFSGDLNTHYRSARKCAETLFLVTKGFREYEIIAVLRNQVDFIISAYSQHVHEGGSASREQFLSNILPNDFQWDDWLSEFERVFGSDHLTVLSYNSFVRDQNPGIIDSVKSLIETSLPNTVLPKPSVAAPNNPSLKGDLLEFLRIANGVLDSRAQHRFRCMLQNFVASGNICSLNKTRPILADHKRNLEMRYDDGNFRVSQRYRVKFEKSAHIVTDSNQDYETPSIESVVALMALIQSKPSSENQPPLYLLQLIYRFIKNLSVQYKQIMKFLI